jgi:hypothetical protein
MAEILKIISPVGVKNRIQDMPKPQSTDAIFDLKEPDGILKDADVVEKTEEEGAKQELLKHLNKELLLPLFDQTKTQAAGIRRLVLYSKLFQVPGNAVTEEFLNEFFVLPKELLNELIKREEAASIYRGDFFEAMRVLVKEGNYPKLETAILSILKHFDCYVNQRQSLDAILVNVENLSKVLIRQDAKVVNEVLDRLETLVNIDEDNYREVLGFLKRELTPVLREVALNYPPADRVQDSVLSVIHYIVRFDKADPNMLEDAFESFAEELKPLFTHLTDENLADMKETLFKDAKQAKDLPVAGGFGENEEKDAAELLSKALDKSSPAKISSTAQNLLMHMIQSESPMQPLLHFLIPLRFRHEDTYGEFFIDKECKGRKGEAKKATNIFFTVQSDLYGTFEVDLLAKDKFIELEIKGPEDLLDGIRGIKGKFRDLIEGEGYRLSNYRVLEYTESKTILRRFPHLAERKVGIDVKV